MTQVDLLKKYGLSVRGKLGQHILIDANVCRKIVEALHLTAKDEVLEIGPGLGALTGELLASGARVTAVEKDPRFAAVLEEELKPKYGDRFQLVCEDFLEFDFSRYGGTPDRKTKVISNLPYYVTAPILFRLFEQEHFFSQAVLMMQKEVARRLIARPGTKDYGRLSVACQYFSQLRHVRDVPPSCFTPRPQVDSSVVELHFIPQAQRLAPARQERLFELVRTAFSQRRKTLAHLLARDPQVGKSRDEIDRLLDSLGFVRGVRGEALSLDQFKALSELLG